MRDRRYALRLTLSPARLALASNILDRSGMADDLDTLARRPSRGRHRFWPPHEFWHTPRTPDRYTAIDVAS